MIYLVHTIKEFTNNTINTDFVIEAENENVIKSLMSQYKVIVLGVTLVPGRPKSGRFFGNFQDKENKIFRFCLKADSIEGACSRCIDLELPLISIDDITSPITAEQSETIIKKLIEQKDKETEEQKKLEEQKQKKTNALMDDKRKEKIMSVIGETLHDITAMEEKNILNETIPLNEKKKLHDLKESLTKIKMGSNIEKATSVLEETFVLMEKIENESLSQMKEEEQRIMSASIISNIDIISELDKLRRANQGNQAGTKKNSSDLYYTYLGIVGLYQKFIVKDIFHNLLEFKKVLIYVIEYVGFGLVSMSTLIGLIFTYNDFNQTLNQNILLSMIYIGLLGLTRELPLAVRKSSFFMSIVYIILAIIISIVIQNLLITNFALV